MNSQVYINLVVEGIADEQVGRKLIEFTGHSIGNIYGKKGKNFIINKIKSYLAASKFSYWFVILDLDKEICAPDLKCRLLGHHNSSKLFFCIAVKKIEAWLLADRDSISKFLSVPKIRIPTNPDQLNDPKETLVNLASMSKNKSIREDMSPGNNPNRKTGKAYSSRLVEYTKYYWRPDKASENSESLRRAISKLLNLNKLLNDQLI